MTFTYIYRKIRNTKQRFPRTGMRYSVPEMSRIHRAACKQLRELTSGRARPMRLFERLNQARVCGSQMSIRLVRPTPYHI